MRLLSLIASLIFLQPYFAVGQPNCNAIADKDCAMACRIFNAADSFYQGSPQSQYYMDSALKICPSFAPAWREKGVPYLKRGEFVTWRKYIDKAVELSPKQYLSIRGWCRYKFLKDYEGALADLKRYDTLSRFAHDYSGDGNYELHIIMALCERELGNYQAALHYFAIGIDSVTATRGASAAGLYSYLHLGVTRMRLKDYAGAIKAFNLQNQQYDKFAETYYYIGLVNFFTGKKSAAKEHLLHAKQLITDTNGKYKLNDPYCEMSDTVYLSDIDAALKRLD